MSNKTENRSESKIIALDNIFDDFIKPGQIQEEKEIVPGFKIKVKPLNLQDLALSDLVNGADMMPNDVLVKVKAAKVLSMAILAVNDKLIESDDENEESKLREALYKNLMKLPAIVVQKSYEFYLDISKKRDELFINSKEVSETLENF